MDDESRNVEEWLNSHPEFFKDYFLRKANYKLVDLWLRNYATKTRMTSDEKDSHVLRKPLRKISSHDFLPTSGHLQPMLHDDGCGAPTFLEPDSYHSSSASNSSATTTLTEKKLDEKELIWELLKDIYNDLDVNSVCHKILKNVSALVQADRCSLFLVHGSESEMCLISELFDVNYQQDNSQPTNGKKIIIDWGRGIAGYVAKTGAPVVISDVYQDVRFDKSVDELTGYKTVNMMCYPITHTDGQILGVAQAINKRDCYQGFTDHDKNTFASYLAFCGIVLRNVQMYEKSRIQNRRNQVLLDLARIVCEEQCKLTSLTHKIMKHAQQLIQCCKCQIYLLSAGTKAEKILSLNVNGQTVFSQVFEYEPCNEASQTSSPDKTVIMDTVSTKITCYVAGAGVTVNLPDDLNSHDLEFNLCQRGQSILAVPIHSADHQRVIGVFQLINKLDGSKFTKNDEQIFEAFAIFCGIGIENTIMYERVVQAQARQSVALEVLTYHAVASNDLVTKLQHSTIKSSQDFDLLNFSFDDSLYDDDQTIKATVRMFLDLDLIDKFQINYQTLCRWILSVKKNYRNISYHNWRHAFNVAQCMFSCLKTGRLLDVIDDLEAMCLIMACLCHDLDHRGTNNQFHLKTASPLSILYSTSVLEHHHFDHCIMLLNADGNQIFANLDQSTYDKAMNIIERSILATDLALYFKKRDLFFNKVDSGSSPSSTLPHYTWDSLSNRELLFSMLMTSCDVSAISKPWPVQQRVATLVANEFFEQGDLEREQLNIKPTAMMDRSRKNEIPNLQVQFIDSICLPLYQRIVKVSSQLYPLLEGCLDNRKNWLNEAEKIKQDENLIAIT